MSVSGVDSPGAGEIAEYHLTWNNYNSSLISFLKHITPIQASTRFFTDFLEIFVLLVF